MFPKKTTAKRLAASALFLCAALAATAQQHQTATVSDIGDGSALPYQIQVSAIDLGTGTNALPTLHSYARAEHNGLWVMMAGRTNGLHGFTGQGDVNFPAATQNRDVWVVDPSTGQTWSRSLQSASAGLTDQQVASLTPTNNQFTQIGDTLYMTGGYGRRADGILDTFDTLSAIDLPGIIDWVQNDTGSAANSIRQINDESFRVTGGAMYDINGTTHLVFGQSFRGPYVPNRNGDYTNQVRHFTITDDGTTLGFTNASASTPEDAFRRRDLNVYTTLQSDGAGGTTPGLVALSGVFTQNFGAWTVPVVIDENGNPTMVDPEVEDTFRQGFNGYHSAKIGLYSQNTGEMHEMLFGGISLQTLDDQGDTVTDNFPALCQRYHLHRHRRPRRLQPTPPGARSPKSSMVKATRYALVPTLSSLSPMASQCSKAASSTSTHSTDKAKSSSATSSADSSPTHPTSAASPTPSRADPTKSSPSPSPPSPNPDRSHSSWSAD